MTEGGEVNGRGRQFCAESELKLRARPREVYVIVYDWIASVCQCMPAARGVKIAISKAGATMELSLNLKRIRTFTTHSTEIQ